MADFGIEQQQELTQSTDASQREKCVVVTLEFDTF
jgi:hypothetical protein